LAQALELEKGEEIDWVVEDRNHLVLPVCARRQASCGAQGTESKQVMLPGWALAQQSYSPMDGAASEKEEGGRAGKPRFEQIDREQLFWRIVNVEQLIAEDHPARAI